MQQVTKNIFTKGLNTDIDHDLIQADSYIEANNLSLVNDGKFFALQNLKGTTKLGTIYTSVTNQKVLGLYLNKYKINGQAEVEAFTIIAYNKVTGLYEIILIGKDTAGAWGAGDKLTLFSDTVDITEFEKIDPYVDGVSYSENGVDTLYFTDGYHEIRKLRCEIEDTTSFSPLTKSTLSLTRRYTTAEITTLVQGPNGSLLCGSYQYAVRLINNDTKTYTKFTLLSNPLTCTNSDLYKVEGGIGQNSGKLNNIFIDISTDESLEYTHYQLAVVENIEAVENSSTTSYLLTPQSLTGGTTTYQYVHSANERFETISLDELVIDKAAVKSVRSLQIKNNRLFGGNVVYYNLDYDNGDPSLYSGFVRYALLDDDTSQQSKNKGYFRDEVYRFAISYFDEYYNFSRPKVLDMSSITDNKISGSTDMKFPKRSDGNQWTILDSGDRVRHLGLNLVINNHPTWAKGFVILRAKRKKNVLFQTPFIPASYIAGMQADTDYPTTYLDMPRWDAGKTHGFSYSSDNMTNIESAQPMNPTGTYMPKNLFKPLALDSEYKKLEGVVLNDYYDKTFSGSVTGINDSPTSLYKVIFPPSTILNFADALTNSNNAFKFKGSEGYELVDIAHVKMKYNRKDIPPFSSTLIGDGASIVLEDFVPEDGDAIRTNVDGTFYAIENEAYHYDASYTAGKDFSSLPDLPTSGKFVDYEVIDAFGEGAVVGGNWFGNYDNLITNGAEWGVKPDNMKMAVVKLNDYHPDATYYSRTPFNYGCAGGSLATTFLAEPTSNKLIYEYQFYDDADYVNLVEIVNVTSGLKDNRYGSLDTPHEFISTGAYYVFRDTELTDVENGTPVNATVDVWGGDCYISLCNYKITNGHYSIAGQDASWTDSDVLKQIAKFDRAYVNDFDDVVYQVPVGMEGIGATVSVYLESEYPLNVQDSNEYTKDSGLAKSISYSGDAALSRQAFNYLFNINLAKQNDQKIFIPFQEFEKKVNTFQSRIIYSNQKIYQSDLEGFDQFNALDFYDLNETNGKIIKLPKAGGNVYAIQTDGIAYIPIQANVLETADGATLSVNSGDIISTPQYISNKYGAQHSSLVIDTSDSFYLADTKRKSILKVAGGLEDISEGGFINITNDLLTRTNKSYDYSMIYDLKRKELILSNIVDGKTYVFNERIGQWISAITFENDIQILNGSGIQEGLYISAIDINSDLVVSKMYSGTPNNLFGEIVQSTVTFVVNPEIDFPKVYDNLIVFSDNKLDSFDITIENELGQVNSEATGINLDIDRREGAYRAKILRDANNARLRGRRAKIKAFWPISDDQISLSSIATKYRISERRI